MNFHVAALQDQTETRYLFAGRRNGYATAEALAAYQRSVGRPATGLPDQQTLHELLT